MLCLTFSTNFIDAQKDIMYKIMEIISDKICPQIQARLLQFASIKSPESQELSDFEKQQQGIIDVYQKIYDNWSENKAILEHFRGEVSYGKHKFRTCFREKSYLSSHFTDNKFAKDASNTLNSEGFNLLGIIDFKVIPKKPTFWEKLLMLALSVCQIVAGWYMCWLSNFGATILGVNLMFMGVEDLGIAIDSILSNESIDFSEYTNKKIFQISHIGLLYGLDKLKETIYQVFTNKNFIFKGANVIMKNMPNLKEREKDNESIRKEFKESWNKLKAGLNSTIVKDKVKRIYNNLSQSESNLLYF